MSEQESNICAICGGVTLAWYQAELNEALNNPGKEIYTRILPEPFRICGGHPDPHPPHKYCPKCGQWRDLDGICCGRCGTTLVLKRLDEQTEPAPKHDGKLNDFDEVRHLGRFVFIGNGGHLNNHVELQPSEALSLLAWLTQERKELERLAKEQAG